MKTRLTVVLAVALGAGCGDDGPAADASDVDAFALHDAATSDAAVSSIDDLCAEDGGLYVRFFGKAFECFPELEFLFGRVPGAAELHTACVASVEPFLADGTEVLGDAEAMADCAAYLDSLTCAKFDLDEPTPCDGVLVGTVPADGVCDQDEQCAGDARCDKSGGTTCGACKARQAIGQTCNDRSECASGRCAAGGTCEALVAMGGACDVAEDCVGANVCDADSKCNPEPSWAVGTPCAGQGDLACDPLGTDLYCAPDLTQGAGTCQQFVARGATCVAGGRLCKFLDGDTCQSDGAGGNQCTAPTVMATGQACNIFAGTTCAPTNGCRDHDSNGSTPDQCAVIVGEGGACSGDVCDVLLNCIAGECQYGDYTGMCPQS